MRANKFKRGAGAVADGLSVLVADIMGEKYISLDMQKAKMLQELQQNMSLRLHKI